MVYLGICCPWRRVVHFLNVYLLPKDKALVDQIIKMGVAFAGGIGSGYGIKSFKDRKQ